jgi:outer membrane protein OmpA-like peptidoglycan-associated protein
MEMKQILVMTGAIVLTLAGTGCATKKYVTQRLEPVETKLSAVDAKNDTKNSEQDTKLTTQGKEIEELGTDLSRSKERLAADIATADQKAVAAGQSAAQAGQRADGAQTTANGAQTLAQQGIQRTTSLERVVDGLNKYHMTKSVTVLFQVNQSKLNDDAKAQLDDLAKSTAGLERYMIEVQGFTDKTGTADINEKLSQDRAASAARYLVNEHMIPVRTINTLGSGYAAPVGDDKTRDGRKQNRRVEIRLFVPETGAGSAVATTAQN